MFGLLFTLAGSGAFAESALEQLETGSPNFDGTSEHSADVQDPAVPAAVDTPAGKSENPTETRAEERQIRADNKAALDTDTRNAPPAAATTAIPAVPAATAAPTPPAPAPNPFKELISKHKEYLVMGALGAYLGFALLGPAGIAAGIILTIGVLLLHDL